LIRLFLFHSSFTLSLRGEGGVRGDRSEEKIMKKKIKGKDFIISIIGRDLRKTPEPEEKRKEDLQESASRKEDSGKKQILKKDKTHYRVEYTKDGPKFWTLH
jgi:hypothetical protein